MRTLLLSKPGRIGGLLGMLLTVLTGWVLLNFNFHFSRWSVQLSYDLPFLVRPVEVPDGVRMVYLNDDAHRTLGQPYDSAWDRNIHARLVEQLTLAGARAVVFDIVFSGPSTNAAADERLARAIRANGRVILAAEYVPFAFGGAEGYRLERPDEPIKNAAVGLGITQVKPDEDQEVRQHYHGPLVEPEPVLSESWAAAKLVGVTLAQNDGSRGAHRWVNYYCPPGLLPGTAIHQAIETDGVAPGFFSNQVVFVGSYLSTAFSGQRKDEFLSPFTAVGKGGEAALTRKSYMAGVEVHATMFLNLLRQDWLSRSSAVTELLALLLVGVVFGGGLVQIRPLGAVTVALLGILGLTGLAYTTFTRWHYWFPWLAFVLQVFVAMNWAVVFNSIQLYVQKKLLEQTLSRYVSAKLVKHLSEHPETLRKFTEPGAEKRTLTILFTDLADFTSISERMDSDDLAREMNQYFQMAAGLCVFPQDGTLVGYLGDSIFAIWNAPDDQPDHALRACLAALSFREQVPQVMNGRRLHTRLGLHTGEANVGNFGTTEKVAYTALGESINLASRMEGLNKHLHTTVLATGDTYESVRAHVVGRSCGVFRVKGFGRAVKVYELLDRAEKSEATQVWREVFERALESFCGRDWAKAEAGFQRVLELKPDDGPAAFYLHKLAELRGAPPPPEWQGEVELSEK